MRAVLADSRGVESGVAASGGICPAVAESATNSLAMVMGLLHRRWALRPPLVAGCRGDGRWSVIAVTSRTIASAGWGWANWHVRWYGRASRRAAQGSVRGRGGFADAFTPQIPGRGRRHRS